MKLEMPLGQWAGIAIYDDVLDKEACIDLVRLVKRHWQRLLELDILFPGKTSGGVQSHTKNSMDMNLSSLGLGDEMYFMEDGWHEYDLHNGLFKCVNHYVNQYPGLASYCSPMQDTGYQLQKYEMGYGKYDEHIDGGPFFSSFDRMFAVIVYLNDVNEGGETTFTRQGISVKPVTGRVLIFPCHWLYPHRGEIAFDTDKYIITTFIMQETMNHLIRRPPSEQGQFHDHFETNKRFDSKIASDNTYVEDFHEHSHDHENHEHDNL